MIDTFLNTLGLPTQSGDQVALDQPITEVAEVIRNLLVNAPGPDGFTAEFYKGLCR